VVHGAVRSGAYSCLMEITRLRQAVVVAEDRDAILAAWQREFGLGSAFDDPGVAEFGLHNWVVPVADAFLEVVAPTQPNTTAGRYMERNGGDAGYMVIFQVADIGSARNHLRAEGCRTVWNADLATVSGTHLHPADSGGAIISVDQPRPSSSWLWGGPDWEANVRTDVLSGLCGIVVADPKPDQLRERWARLLQLQFTKGPADTTTDMATLPSGDTVRIIDSALAENRVGLVGIDLRATVRSAVGRSVRIAAVDFRLV
jgi:hypothetical protein